MTSPLSRISAGSFFTGLIFEYSSLGWPGTTVAGTNSILSIRPSSIAAMRTLRANGEAGENVSFIGRISLKGRSLFFSVMAGLDPAIHVSIAANSLSVDARDKPGHDEFCGCISHELKRSRRDDFLPLLAKRFDAERDDVAGVEEFRRLHAGADAGRCAGGDDVARQQREESRNVGNAFRDREDHGRGRSGLAALAVDVEPHRQFLHVRYLVLGHQPGSERTEGVVRLALGPLTQT